MSAENDTDPTQCLPSKFAIRTLDDDLGLPVGWHANCFARAPKSAFVSSPCLFAISAALCSFLGGSASSVAMDANSGGDHPSRMLASSGGGHLDVRQGRKSARSWLDPWNLAACTALRCLVVSNGLSSSGGARLPISASSVTSVRSGPACARADREELRNKSPLISLPASRPWPLFARCTS